MRLGVVLLWCLFILCITRAAERPLSAFKMRVSSWAALPLLLLCANAFVWRIAPEFECNPAALLLCVATAVSAKRACGFSHLIQAAAFAIPASLCMLALSRLQASGAVALPEPGLLLAIPAILFLLPLAKSPAAAIFGASLAPLLLGVWEAGLELYAFGYTIMQLGMKNAFDAQVAAAMLTGLLLAPYAMKRENMVHEGR